MLLTPGQEDAQIRAIAAAADAAGRGTIREQSGPWKLHLWVRLRSNEYFRLLLLENGQVGAASANGQPMLIDSPDLKRALEALEAEVARAPGVGTRIWAVDPTGKAANELLVDLKQPLFWAGMSPDGRYLLLTEQLGEYKGDYTAIPYLLDRADGSLKQGPKSSVRFAVWSGTGFQIDRLLHLDLNLRVESRDALAAALGLKPDTREIIDISFAPDGKRFAALVGKRWSGPPEPVDLVMGNLDGSGLTVVPKVITGVATQIGDLAYLALSPDGQWLAISGQEGTALARTAAPAPDGWVWLQKENTLGTGMEWAPDSRHIRVGQGGVYNLTGNPVFQVESNWGLVWRDGRGGVAYTHLWRAGQFGLSGVGAEVKLPDFSIPRAFLPDGRLLVWNMTPKR